MIEPSEFVNGIFEKVLTRRASEGYPADACAFVLPAPDPTESAVSFKVSPVCVVEGVATKTEVETMRPKQIYPIGTNPVLQVTDHSRFRSENLLYDGIQIPEELWDLVFTPDTIIVPVTKAPTPELSSCFWVLHKKEDHTELVATLPFGDAAIYFETLPMGPFTLVPEISDSAQLKQAGEIAMTISMTRVRPTVAIKVSSPYSLCYLPIRTDSLAPGSKAVTILSTIIDGKGAGYSLSGVATFDYITGKKVTKEGVKGISAFTKIIKKKEKEMKGLPSPLKSKLGIKLPAPKPVVEAPEVEEPVVEEPAPIEEVVEAPPVEEVAVPVEVPAPIEEPEAVDDTPVEEPAAEPTPEPAPVEKKQQKKTKPTSIPNYQQVLEAISSDVPVISAANMEDCLNEVRQLRDLNIAIGRRLANLYTQLYKAADDSIRKMEAIKEAMK